MINVLLNGDAKAVDDGLTLAEFIAAVAEAPQSLATAVNGEFVPRDARTELRLHDGDQVFTFQPITGG
jgi:sulfur carrier protein